jgi:uncharacterized protein
MRLDLTELARTPGMRAEQEIDQPCPEELGVECTSNVKGNIKLSNTGNLLLIEGQISTDMKFPCSRCLIDFSMLVEAPIEEQFRVERVIDAATVLPMEEEDEAVEAALVTNNVLDIDELIRQNLLLVLPIQPLCKEDCAGLCPTCGENLNVRQCSCPPGDVESPFRVLADLLEDENERDA